MSKKIQKKVRARKHKEILQGQIGMAHRAKRKASRKHPPHMVPGVKIDPGMGRGEVVGVFPPGQDPCWEEFLKDMGFGGMLEVLDIVEIRAWEVYSVQGGKQVMHYIKAKVRRRGGGKQQIDIDALCKEISKRKIPKPPKKANDFALMVLLSDWQAGTRDGGGIKALIDRVLDRIDRLIHRIKEIRPKKLVIGCMGDLVEGCVGFYPMQTFSVELDRREQCRVVRRMLMDMILRVAGLVPEIVVVAVGGNHGENRRAGKAFTSFGDNDDVAVVEQVAEICAQNKDLGHVSFVVPDQELTATLDVCGISVALAHGHQARRGGKPQQRLLTWWRDMAHTRHAVGDCDLLVTAHYHHLQVCQTGPKTWFQCPALDGGSQWWEESGGDKSIPGMLTLLVGKQFAPLGWDGLKVL